MNLQLPTDWPQFFALVCVFTNQPYLKRIEELHKFILWQFNKENHTPGSVKYIFGLPQFINGIHYSTRTSDCEKTLFHKKSISLK